MNELRFLVPGMTCGHCVAAVDEELRKVEGVTAVAIDLESKVVVVVGGGPAGATAAWDLARAGRRV